MTRFIDGPAAGVTLCLRRAPIFLRVVCDEGITGTGRVDALDQLDDTPRPTETLYAYRIVGKPGVVHVDSTDKKTGRRVGRWYATAEYRLCPEQPAQMVMADTGRWRAWCIEQQAAAGKGDR